jgi:hypothetical protein
MNARGLGRDESNHRSDWWEHRGNHINPRNRLVYQRNWFDHQYTPLVYQRNWLG